MSSTKTNRRAHLVVVGASLAGLRAVESARASGFGGDITLVGAESMLPYDRPPLSKEMLSSNPVPNEPTFVNAHGFESLGVTMRLGVPATGLDPVDRAVLTDSGGIGYDHLVLATGSHARTLPDSANLSGVHVLRTLADSHAVRHGLDTARRVAVIGGGFIGAEVASAAAKRGIPTTIVESATVPLVRAVGTRMGAVLSELHRRNGVELSTGVAIDSLRGGSHVEEIVLTDGRTLAADLVVVGIGSEPSTQWLAGSGIELDHGVVCGSDMSTSFPGIFAAGDVARWFNPTYGEHMRLENWTSATEQGRVAGCNAVCTGTPQSYSTVPYAWSDWYGHRIQVVGVPSDDVEVASGDTSSDRFLALFYKDGLVVGALAVNARSHVMKQRGLISRRATRAEALSVVDATDRRAHSAASATQQH